MQIQFYAKEDDRETISEFRQLADNQGKSVSAYIIKLMKQELKTRKDERRKNS